MTNYVFSEREPDNWSQDVSLNPPEIFEKISNFQVNFCCAGQLAVK